MNARSGFLGLAVLCASAQASAALITLSAADHAIGTDVSHQLSGAALSSYWGHQGDFALSQSSLIVTEWHGERVFATTEPVLSYGDGTQYSGVFHLATSGLFGLREDTQLFRVDFATPTDYVSLLGGQRSAGTLMYAFDSSGQQIGACGSDDNLHVDFTPVGDYGCWGYLGMNVHDDNHVSLSVTRPTADISYIVAGTAFAGTSFFSGITYNQATAAVSEPATLGLLGLGLLGLGIARRRTTRH